MDAIVRANQKEVEVEKKMCEALREIFADEFKESRKTVRKEGEDRVGRLYKCLLQEKRIDDLSKSIDDPEYREVLMKQYNIN